MKVFIFLSILMVDNIIVKLYLIKDILENEDINMNWDFCCCLFWDIIRVSNDM